MPPGDEPDPFAPHAAPEFKSEAGEVDKLAASMDTLAASTHKVNTEFSTLRSRGDQVMSSIGSIFTGVGLKAGGRGGGSGGHTGNGGNPTVPGGPEGGGNNNGGLADRIIAREGGPSKLLAADFGLDIARYIGSVPIPGYNRMQKMMQAGLPLDAYATQWSGAYGRAPSQIPSRIVNGGAIGTPAQVAGAAQYGASIGAIPGVNQVGGAYWSSINQIQRLAPGVGPEQASQLAGNFLNPQTNATIAMRYGMGASPMQPGGTLKTFTQTAADLLKALNRSTTGGSAKGQLPTKEQLLAGLLPGSRMRQQMRVGMGLDDDTITMVINWGIQNASYASRGGQGMYDPSNEAQRKLANGSGVKDSLSNYALTYQQAQTNQVSNFMQGQYGSLQDMTQTQTDLVNVMSKVDDAFTGLYALIGPTGPVLAGFLGMVSQLGSAIIALRAFSLAVGVSGGAGASGVAGTASTAAGTGSGIAGAAGAATAAGVTAGAASAIVQGIASNQLRKEQGKKPAGIIPNLLAGNFNPMDWFGDLPIGDPGTAGMSGDFKKRVSAMMAANPNITVTSGSRSASQQGALNRAGVGRVGSAGDSWHVRGMAADLGPPSQFGWIAKNAAKFGLDSGARMGEPWHVQPRGTAGKRPPENLFINQSARGAGAAYRGFKGAVGDLPGLSISEIMANSLSVNASNLFASGGTSAAAGAAATGGGTQVSTAGSGQVDRVISFLYAQLGKPYKTNTQGPDTYDCSGLVTAAYKTIGINLPALTFSQVKMGTAVPIDPGAIKPGDCVFMRGGSPPTDLGHVGVAVSSTQMISAPKTGDVVHVSNIPWSGIQAIRRYVGSGGATASGSVDTSGSWNDFLQKHMETSGKLDPSATMSGAQVAAAFYRAGFRGQALTDIVAISGRESGWNPTAFNFHAKTTGDISLGLVQENLKDSMINRLQAIGLTDPRQLFNADNAARGAFALSGGGKDFSPWGGYKGMSNTYNTNMQSAANAVADAKQQGLIGDLPVGGGGGGAATAGSTPASTAGFASPMVMRSGGGGMVVNMNFYISGSGDAQSTGVRVAQVAAQALRQHMDREAARSM